MSGRSCDIAVVHCASAIASVRVPASLGVQDSRVVRLLWTVADPDRSLPSRSVLSSILGVSGAALSKLVGRLVECGAVRRAGHELYLRASVGGVCPSGCGAPLTRGDVCDACRQVTRSDRTWQHAAVAMLVEGASPTLISARLKQPLWPTEESIGVVAVLLQEAPGLVSPDWRRALADVTGVKNDTTSRARERRRTVS